MASWEVSRGNSNPPGENGRAVSVPPAEEFLERSSGGGRRPDNDHDNFSHSNATPCLDFGGASLALPALEVRLALFGERFDAFLGVVREIGRASCRERV